MGEDLGKLTLHGQKAARDLDLQPVYLELGGQAPPTDGVIKPYPLPERSEGPHFAYAVQWGVFTLIAIGAADAPAEAARARTATAIFVLLRNTFIENSFTSATGPFHKPVDGGLNRLHKSWSSGSNAETPISKNRCPQQNLTQG